MRSLHMLLVLTLSGSNLACGHVRNAGDVLSNVIFHPVSWAVKDPFIVCGRAIKQTDTDGDVTGLEFQVTQKGRICGEGTLGVHVSILRPKLATRVLMLFKGDVVTLDHDDGSIGDVLELTGMTVRNGD